MKHYLVKELYTQIPQQDVAEVKVNGWVRTMRDSKTFAFIRRLNHSSHRQRRHCHNCFRCA